jgi:hypothetical protein
VDVCVDPEKLADERGGIQSGDSATGTLRACPLTSGNEACQNINLILRFFSDLQKLYLPWLGRPLP